MFVFVDRDGNPVDMNDPQAFIAGVKNLKEEEPTRDSIYDIMNIIPEAEKEELALVLEALADIQEAWQRTMEQLQESANDIAEAMVEAITTTTTEDGAESTGAHPMAYIPLTAFCINTQAGQRDIHPP